MTDEIRAAKTSDLPAIARIISTANQNAETHCIQSSATNDARVIQSEMQDLFDQDELRFVVAELGGQIIGCLGTISQIIFASFLENIIHHTAVDPKYPSSIRLIASIRLEIFQNGLTSCFWVDFSQDLVFNTGSRTHTAPIPWVV